MKQIAMLALFISGAAAMTDPVYALEKATDTAVTPVTVDNFVRAESDTYIESMAKEGGLGKLYHRREPASIDKQTVIRLNRDTLYTSGVFDLDAGPVNITLPDPGKRFMSLQVVNQDHYTPNVFYGAGSHTLTRENVGTRYVFTAIRTLVDPNKSTLCRTRLAPAKRVPVLWSFLTGRQPVRRKCVMRYWFSHRRSLISRKLSAHERKLTPFTICWAPLRAGGAIRTRMQPI
jgi:hypothetical protein